MKIAIIAWAHLGSTFPYVKRLIDRGYKIDLYLIASKNLNIEGFYFNKTQINSGINIIDKNIAPDIFNYVNSENFKFFAIRNPRTYDNVQLIFKFAVKYRNFYYKNIIKTINGRGYDRVHLIGRYNCDAMIDFIKRIDAPLTVGLHEVCDHFNKDFSKPSPLIKAISEAKIPIVVHSKNVEEDLLAFGIFDKKNVSCIHFGLFETFSTIKDKNVFDLPKHYILSYGYINPYKGMDVLYDAFCKNRDVLSKHKFVIAGFGHVDVLDKIKEEPNFTCINRYLTNYEIVELIKGADFILCPYKTMSQSGIPQTVFNFEKPIIASDLNAFTDVIEDGANGMLFPVGDSETLGNCILKMLDKDTCASLQGKVLETWRKKKAYDWDYIADRYSELWH